MMPCDYSKYPANWKSEIVPAIRERSGDKCEGCGVLNKQWRVGHHGRVITVVLTVAHMDHDLNNNDGMDMGGPAVPVEDANLVHLCQRCHLGHDADHHVQTRRRKRELAAGQGLLF